MNEIYETPDSVRRKLRDLLDERTPAQVAKCDHKFIDSLRCLKCGWLSPDVLPAQVAEEEAREAQRLAHRGCPDGVTLAECGNHAHAAIDRAVKAARWEAAEEMLQTYYAHSWDTDNPAIQPALEAECDRLKRELEEASK